VLLIGNYYKSSSSIVYYSILYFLKI